LPGALQEFADPAARSIQTGTNGSDRDPERLGYFCILELGPGDE
jgi:hypothetical protein